jgi:hypothetical protein
MKTKGEIKERIKEVKDAMDFYSTDIEFVRLVQGSWIAALEWVLKSDV